MHDKSDEIVELFKGIQLDDSWAFADLGRSDTGYITHNYHRYPAKFIPQIVSRLLKKYTEENDLVVDPFGGCGTTLVESKVMCRSSIGVDINPVATLITKAKITPIDPPELEKAFVSLEYQLSLYKTQKKIQIPRHERIDYWFKPEQKRKLAFLFFQISNIEDQNIRDFFYCAFSHILKNCSIWLQKSNKPTRDLGKQIVDPFTIFSQKAKRMLQDNADFYSLLQRNGCLETPCDVYCSDARDIPVGPGSVDFIVTSPPYVTSYEYADLHQLTALWFEYIESVNGFRERFIGSSYHNNKDLTLNSRLAQQIEGELLKEHKKTAEGVAGYFGEMNQVFIEMKRILKKNGKIAIVIGNTTLKGIDILNAEVFVEQLQNLGLKIEDIIQRRIPSKNLPTWRNAETGRFSAPNAKKAVRVYPTEYIIIMEKP